MSPVTAPSTATAASHSATGPAGAPEPRADAATPAAPCTFALLDALDPIPLAPPLQLARELVDRMANIRLREDGLVLTGVWARSIPWTSISAIELCSRLDGLVALGLGFTPLGRLPRAVEAAESAVVGTLERVAGGPLAWARERAGWTVIRIRQHDGTTDLRRLPGLVARLYPATTRAIVAAAEARSIEVLRRGCSEEGSGDAEPDRRRPQADRDQPRRHEA